MIRRFLLLFFSAFLCGSTVLGSVVEESEPFRPEKGKFPPLEKAHAYRGELIFVDHANRRGSLRIDGDGRFRFAAPSPFALLPYGLVRYHGSPADLRDQARTWNSILLSLPLRRESHWLPKKRPLEAEEFVHPADEGSDSLCPKKKMPSPVEEIPEGLTVPTSRSSASR